MPHKALVPRTRAKTRLARVAGLTCIYQCPLFIFCLPLRAGLTAEQAAPGTPRDYNPLFRIPPLYQLRTNLLETAKIRQPGDRRERPVQFAAKAAQLPTIWSAVRAASALAVKVGFTAPTEGISPGPEMNRFSTS